MTSLQSPSLEHYDNRRNKVLDQISKAISKNSAQAVYFNMVDVQDIDTSVQTSIIDNKPLDSESLHKKYPNVLFFDSSWELINPSKWYVKLVTDGLDVEDHEVSGEFTGNFHELRCEKRGTVYKPEIEAGSHNPYKKMTVARQSSSRRMKTLRYLEKVSKKELSLMQTIITMPDNISKDLFKDKNGKEKFHKITKKFVKKYGIFLQGHAKVSEDFQIGVWLNEHPWSSNIPLNDHLHGHLCYPNILVDRKTQKIVRFKPLFTEDQLNAIKNIWKEVIREVLGDNNELHKEINVFHNYAKEKARKLHLLKYCTRSWLHDVGKYFNNCSEQNDDLRFEEYCDWMKERFTKFKDCCNRINFFLKVTTIETNFRKP